MIIKPFTDQIQLIFWAPADSSQIMPPFVNLHSLSISQHKR